MGELGRRFQQHMVLRGFADATKESDSGAMVRLFHAYGGTPPDQLTCDQVQSHIARLINERHLLHVLPSGLQKVRAYGWLASRNKQPALAAIRKTLGAQPPPPPPETERNIWAPVSCID